jgi:hypothetical protein
MQVGLDKQKDNRACPFSGEPSLRSQRSRVDLDSVEYFVRSQRWYEYEGFSSVIFDPDNPVILSTFF